MWMRRLTTSNRTWLCTTPAPIFWRMTLSDVWASPRPVISDLEIDRFCDEKRRTFEESNNIWWFVYTGIVRRDEIVFAEAKQRSIPIVMVTSGGYQVLFSVSLIVFLHNISPLISLKKRVYKNKTFNRLFFQQEWKQKMKFKIKLEKKSFINRLIDWLFDCLHAQWVDWLIYWLIYSFIHSFIKWLIDWLIETENRNGKKTQKNKLEKVKKTGKK